MTYSIIQKIERMPKHLLIYNEESLRPFRIRCGGNDISPSESNYPCNNCPLKEYNEDMFESFPMCETHLNDYGYIPFPEYFI